MIHNKETSSAGPQVYTRFPLASVLVYNVVTILHFLLGGVGIVLGYDLAWPAYLVGALYLAFAFAQMYVMMPLVVCPNCFYFRAENALCTSGLNVLSQKIAKEGDPDAFPKRAEGLLCHNNLYMAALFLPILAVIPALILNFSPLLLAVFVTVVGLLLFRFFVIFAKIACVHCRAKDECPNARAMGI